MLQICCCTQNIHIAALKMLGYSSLHSCAKWFEVRLLTFCGKCMSENVFPLSIVLN